MMTPSLYAFWANNDRYPYVLGAEIDQILDNGLVRTMGYNGSLFRPVLIVPLAAGLAMQAKLDALREEYHIEEIGLRDTYRQKVTDIFPVQLP